MPAPAAPSTATAPSPPPGSTTPLTCSSRAWVTSSPTPCGPLAPAPSASSALAAPTPLAKILTPCRPSTSYCSATIATTTAHSPPPAPRRPRAHPLGIIAPLGHTALLRRAGFSSSHIIELDWWEATDFAPSFHVRLTPSRHWSTRLSGGRKQRRWGGHFIQAGGCNAHFVGDTAYAPRCFMSAQHCNPAEVVRIPRDLAASRSLAVHQGTFPLTAEPHDEPPATSPPPALTPPISSPSPPATRSTSREVSQTRNRLYVPVVGTASPRPTRRGKLTRALPCRRPHPTLERSLSIFGRITAAQYPACGFRAK